MPRLSTPLPWTLSILIAVALGAPAPVEAQRAFRSGVDVVALTVTVTDGRGKHVKNLTDRDFTVLEDGVPQPLAFFASEEVPIDLALVLDVSGSMGRHLPIVRKAASGLLRSLRADDQVTVAALTGSLAILQPLTSDRAQVAAALAGLSATGDTAIYNGLYIQLKEFERERLGRSDIRRQAIVLLTDGLDTASHLGLDDVMALAQRVGVSIYVVVVPEVTASTRRVPQDTRTLQAAYAMRSLARDAGGRSFFPQTALELPAIYGDIARELTSQYELAYFPEAPAGAGFRRLAVHVTNANARTRSGYYPPERSATPPAVVGTTYAGERR